MLYLNGKEVEQNFFPNRETYLDIPLLFRTRADSAQATQPVVIGMKFESNDDLIDLMNLKRYLDNLGYKDIVLKVPYFPYSTMDHTDGTRPLALKSVAEFINGLGFSRVLVYEPHSPVLEALVNNIDVRMTTAHIIPRALYAPSNAKYLLSAIGRDQGEKCGRVFLVYPDSGAAKRYNGIIGRDQNCELNMYCASAEWNYDPVIVFDKERNFKDGKLGAMKPLTTLPHFRDSDVCIIVDDLCRKGRTFMEAAKVLAEAGAKHIRLCVTHLERIAFHGVLLDDSPIEKVFATDACIPADPKLNGIPEYEDVIDSGKLEIIDIDYGSMSIELDNDF